MEKKEKGVKDSFSNRLFIPGVSMAAFGNAAPRGMTRALQEKGCGKRI